MLGGGGGFEQENKFVAAADNIKTCYKKSLHSVVW